MFSSPTGYLRKQTIVFVSFFYVSKYLAHKGLQSNPNGSTFSRSLLDFLSIESKKWD